MTGEEVTQKINAGYEQAVSKASFAASDGSTAFRIAAKTLLRQWMTKHAYQYKPGGWDYDKEGAELVQMTADLLGVDDPWKQ
jgi:hypothetical protein